MVMVTRLCALWTDHSSFTLTFVFLYLLTCTGMWGPVALFLLPCLHKCTHATTAFTSQQDTVFLLRVKCIIQTLKKCPFMLVIGMILPAMLLITSPPHPRNVSETNQTFQPQIKRTNLRNGTMWISLQLALTVRCLISKIPSHVRFTLTSISERNKCSRVQTDVLRSERWFGRLCPCRL